VAAARPAAITPQQVAPDGRHRKTLRGVGVALGVVQDLLIGPGPGPLHPGRQPVHAHRLAGLGHLRQQRTQVVQGGDKAAVGLAEAQRAKLAKQQVQAIAHLGLGDPDRSAGTPVRQPVQQHGGDGVQADLQGQRRGATAAGWAGWGKVGQAPGQPGQHLDGQRRTRAV
jgi:hypothetical protein